MNPNDIVFLGLKNRVAAISRLDGHIFWSTDLSGRLGTGFVTVISDTVRVFAYSGGHLHCLDLATGRILWTNELHSYGYGLAGLSLPGISSASEIAAAQSMRNSAGADSGATTAAIAGAS